MTKEKSEHRSRASEAAATKDPATVDRSGRRLQRLLDGVQVREAPTQIDDRGEVCEIWDERWKLTPDPVVFVYQAMVRPHKIKGWVVHKDQEDRMFILSGFLKIVLFDGREGSRTEGLINEFFLSERNRALLCIPAGIFHAVHNIGEVDAHFVNLPSRAYLHHAPDKYRLPLDTDQIPYQLEERLGG